MSANMQEKVPYPFMKSNDMVPYLIENYLYRFAQSAKPKRLEQIKLAYEAYFKAPMLDPSTMHVENICLHGMPGVGKTSVVRSAGQQLAKMLDMNFVSNPAPPYFPKENDLVICTLEMSGEVSNVMVGGIPSASNLTDAAGENVPYMGKLPSYHLSIIGKAEMGILILDDFVNCAPSVQNAALSIALEGRFQALDFGNTYIALTANLGSLDNSTTYALSDPMTSRIGHFYVEDTLPDFENRMIAKFPDSISDAGVLSFLRASPESFMMDPDDDHRSAVNGLRQPFPCPRSWEKLINVMRMVVNRSQASDTVNQSELNRVAAAFVGKKTAAALATHAFKMMTGAEPIAQKAIYDGEFDQVKFEQNYGKSESQGINSKSQDFGVQLAFSLASHAANAINKNEAEYDSVIKNYVTALFKMDASIVQLSISSFSQRLSLIKPEWTDSISKSENTRKTLKTEHCANILNSMIKYASLTEGDIKNISATLVNADRSYFKKTRLESTPGKSPSP